MNAKYARAWIFNAVPQCSLTELAARLYNLVNVQCMQYVVALKCCCLTLILPTCWISITREEVWRSILISNGLDPHVFPVTAWCSLLRTGWAHFTNIFLTVLLILLHLFHEKTTQFSNYSSFNPEYNTVQSSLLQHSWGTHFIPLPAR